MDRMTIRLTPHLNAILQGHAEAADVSAAEIVRLALAKFLNTSVDGKDIPFRIPLSEHRNMGGETIHVPVPVVDEMRRLIREEHQFIGAIKYLREQIGCGLYDGKCIADAVRNELVSQG